MVKNISIEFMESEEVKIFIDGEEQKEIATFELKVEEGEVIYSTRYKMSYKKDDISKMLGETRIRTIQKAMEGIRKIDPDTRISEASVRKNIRNGNIPSQKEGKIYLVDMLDIIEFYKNNKTKKEEKLSGIEAVPL